jgi:prepilin signal peptidase PulO-like enzyme (type II secretory pathway)
MAALLLAQDVPYSSLLFWAVVLIAVLLLLFAAVAWLKKWVERKEEPGQDLGSGFTLTDLRTMHQRGQITDAEFERAKAKTVAEAKAAAERAAARETTGDRTATEPAAADKVADPGEPPNPP